MVTLTKYGAKYNRNVLFLEGLSTDTKPTDEFDGLSIQNGSEYTEVDTGKKFLFDYDNATWYEVQTGGGGGGGGGTSNYNDLSNRPSVNNTVLTGNKTSAQLGLASSEQGGKADSAIQGVKLNGGSAITPDANNIVDISVPITAIQKNGTGITPVSGTVNITVPTSAADVSALPNTTKYAAALNLTINSSTFVMTGQLKDQDGNNLGTAQTIDLPLESVVVNGSYNSQTKKVVLTLQNGNTIEFSVADLVSGLQTELSASNKLNPAYINYNSTHRAVSDTEKSTWNGKQNALSTAQLAAANSGITSADVAQITANKNNISNVQTSLAVGSSDSGKVLTASYSGGTGSYAWVTPSGGGAVSGVKGSEETNYRTGNVSISAANVGAIPTTEKGANNGVAALDSNGKIAAETLKAGALASGMTATTQAISDDSTKLATTAYVHDVVDALPSPMVFKGSLGTGGTITTLPTASSSNKGYVYKVITAGTYASQSAKVGDTFISDGSVWVLIPSGDEPSGTVTNVAVANVGGLTVNGSPITSSGTITVGHSNSVTAKTSSSLKKFTYDAHGHVTGSSELSTAESNALASGINSTKVAQIATNEANILTLETMNGQKNLLYVPSSVTVTDDYAGTPIVFTSDSDGYVTASPQSDSRYFQYSSCQYKIDLSAGEYILYADIKTTVDSGNFKATLLNTSNTTITELSMRNKTGVTTTAFTIATTGSYGLLAKLLGGSSRFMILKKSIWDAGFTTYQPYAMSNAELTAAIKAMQAQLANQ